MVLCFCHGCLNKGIKECNFNQKKKRERESAISVLRDLDLNPKYIMIKKKFMPPKIFFLKKIW